MEIPWYNSSGWSPIGEYLPVNNISVQHLDFTQNCTSSVIYWLDRQYWTSDKRGFQAPCEVTGDCAGSYRRDIYWATKFAAPPEYTNYTAFRFYDDNEMYWTDNRYLHWDTYTSSWDENYTGVANISSVGLYWDIHNQIDSIIYHCLPEHCRGMGFSGNADIAGIGVGYPRADWSPWP
jgi:hypothetical protein